MAGFFENTRRPTKTIGGSMMLWTMNVGHNPCAKWGLGHIDIGKAERILDIGCGGGKNIKNMLKLAPGAMVCGIDYSAASVEKSLKLNKSAISSGLAEIREASVESIPYDENEFDAVTAFETVYFWPDISANLSEVARVLKKDGLFMVCNETQKPEGAERWIEMLDMTVYTGEQIKEHMEKAGFSSIKIQKHKNSRWLCVTGRKNDK